MTPKSDLFPEFPDDARIWVYVADRPLAPDDCASLLDGLDPFLASWTSHRKSVRGAAAVLDDRFLVLAATAVDGNLSGCGIDKSVHRIEEIGAGVAIGWHGSLDVAWRDPSGAVRVDTRSAFRDAAQSGDVDDETPVFDFSVSTLDELRSGLFEKPAGSSWHARYLQARTPES